MCVNKLRLSNQWIVENTKFTTLLILMLLGSQLPRYLFTQQIAVADWRRIPQWYCKCKSQKCHKLRRSFLLTIAVKIFVSKTEILLRTSESTTEDFLLAGMCCGTSQQPNQSLPRRKNGWACPWHCQQVLAWLLILIIGVLYFTTVPPGFPLVVGQIPCYVVSTFFLIPSSIKSDLCFFYFLMLRKSS